MQEEKLKQDTSTIEQLALLSPVEYDQERVCDPTSLGVRYSTLDIEVSKLRQPTNQTETLFEEIELSDYHRTSANFKIL